MSVKYKHINYYNPYSINENLFIKVYKFLRTGLNDSVFQSYFKYFLGLLFFRLAFSLVLRGVKFNVVANYKDIVFSARSTNSQFHSIYFKEFSKCYESDVHAVIDAFLPDNGVFVDIGSNWGHHTFIAAKEKRSTVYSFEPNPMVYGDLKGIVNSLKLENKIFLNNCAIGQKKTSLNLVQSGFESGVASISNKFLKERRYLVLWPQKFVDLITFKSSMSYKTKVVVLDEALGLNRKVDLIKIDAEGAELDCLFGSIETLKKDKPKVVFEIHSGSGENFIKFLDFFNPLGYKFYLIVPNVADSSCAFIPVEKLEPFKQYNILASFHEL